MQCLVAVEGTNVTADDITAMLKVHMPEAVISASDADGRAFASVSMFDHTMTELSRAVQIIEPDRDQVFFVSEAVVTERDGLVSYRAEVTVKRERIGDPE